MEGHWDFFCNFVELCEGVKFKLPGNAAWTSGRHGLRQLSVDSVAEDGRNARTSQELDSLRLFVAQDAENPRMTASEAKRESALLGFLLLLPGAGAG